MRERIKGIDARGHVNDANLRNRRTLRRKANTTAPKFARDEAKGRGALLSDICKGSKLKKVGVVNDRSGPFIENPKGSGVTSGGESAPVQPVGGLFQGGVPKLRPVGDGSAGRSALHPPGTRAAAPRPPGGHDDPDSGSQQGSPPEPGRSQRPSLPDLSRSPGGASSPSPGMKHSSSAPPPPPPVTRRGNAPPAPTQKAAAASYNREKPLPPTPGQRGPSPAPVRENAPPPPVKPPPSPASSRSSSSSSLAPPPPPYRQQSVVSNGLSSPVNEAAPELPQRHNSLNKKPSAGGHTPTRGHAPPPPSPTPQAGRPPPPAREPPGRGAAPPVPGQLSRNGRDAPPLPPPYRTHGSSTDSQSRGKPPPPPSRTPAGPPPPPPPIRNGHTSITRSFVDDFESKYSFHPLDDFPPPEDYRHITKIYPSKANRGESRVMRGAPPLPPVGRIFYRELDHPDSERVNARTEGKIRLFSVVF
ncbi:WAS/WASL-interacting protein family member 2 [Triplophysa tibetana]|uniref:WAS/WASL-interacting protein family member 2 n=1 Tax=Triplophysa tibetana TaxID=1572043 RepID=A0A5A9NJ77_9TELE|nr:WAS/WASL-interacting protein family member 2 [Triplophysa tibetana]